MKLNHIKNAFENRKIEPSASAWDQLASRLDQEEKKNKIPVILWLSAIAAVLVFAVLIYPIVTNDITAVENKNEVVVDDSQNKPAGSYSKEQVKVKPIKVIDPIVKTTSNRQAMVSITSKEKTQTTISNNRKLKTVDKKQKLDFIATTTDKSIANSIEQEPYRNTSMDDNTINPNILNAVAQIAPKKLTSEEEMELLLKEAMKNTTATEVVIKQMNVDQLIREAEWDAETDRRNRVNDLIFDKLGKLKAEAFTLIEGRK